MALALGPVLRGLKGLDGAEVTPAQAASIAASDEHIDNDALHITPEERQAITEAANPDTASQAEMEAGSESSLRMTSPLLVRQAINAVTGDIEAALVAINGV